MHFERNPSNSHRAEKVLRLGIKLTYILVIEIMPRKINTISRQDLEQKANIFIILFGKLFDRK